MKTIQIMTELMKKYVETMNQITIRYSLSSDLKTNITEMHSDMQIVLGLLQNPRIHCANCNTKLSAVNSDEYGERKTEFLCNDCASENELIYVSLADKDSAQ